MIANSKLLSVFNKTGGHCHFCGDSLVLKKYGMKGVGNLCGSWEADHIFQKGKGGNKNVTNCLPSCVNCKRLRWHRNGEDLRGLILFGLIAKDEIKKKTNIGAMLLKLQKDRQSKNEKRRRTYKN